MLHSSRRLEEARQDFTRRRYKPALLRLWDEEYEARSRGDVATLRAIVELAQGITEAASGGSKREAKRLVEQVQESLRWHSSKVDATRTTESADGFHAPPESRQVAGVATASPAATKACPDCAETVKLAARVCRFCGYRFEAIPPMSLDGDQLVSRMRHLFLEESATGQHDSMTFPQWICSHALKTEIAVTAGLLDTRVVEAFQAMASAQEGSEESEHARRNYLVELDRVLEENHLHAVVQRAVTAVFSNNSSLEER
jgi:hypothetical protein